MKPFQDSPELLTAKDDSVVPFGMKVAGAWAWRIGLIIVVGGMLIWLLAKISVLIIPLMMAALFAALLGPVVSLLVRIGLPRGISVAIAEVGLIVVVLGGLFLVGRQMVSGITDLSRQAVTGLIQIQDWLTDGPLKISSTDISGYLDDALNALQSNSSTIASSALGIGTSFGHFGVGVILTLFILIFFLLEGPRIWTFVVHLLPRPARPAVDGAGRKGWTSLGNYVRVQILVAGVDAVGIGAGAAILQVPLALPLAVLVFIGSFIPVVGALVTGAVAVLLALVANGWVNALIMLGIVLLVQQAESHLLQPLVMGRAVNLHPVAVILAVAAGSTLAGILGALFAVPLLAVTNSFIRYIADRGWDNDPDLPKIYGLKPVVLATPAGGGRPVAPSAGSPEAPSAGSPEAPSAGSPEAPSAGSPDHPTTPQGN